MNQSYYKLFPFENKWMEIDGNKIHYTDEGKGATILFCHPSIATSFMYRDFIKELSVSYRCVALDFPGFGFSTASPGYTQTIESQSQIVEKFVASLQLENIYPVMQEIGGHAAMTALAKTPGKVKGIIITDTIIFPVSEYPKIARMLKLVNSPVFNFLNTNFNFLIRVAYRFGIRKRKLDDDERTIYKKLFATKKKRRLITRLLYQLKVEEELIQNVKRSFETIFNNLPVLLIYGDKDPMYQMGIAERIRKMVPDSTLCIIEGEAHFPHEGATGEMIMIIRDWLKSIIDL
jgi:haloalkane dehalogenase